MFSAIFLSIRDLKEKIAKELVYSQTIRVGLVTRIDTLKFAASAFYMRTVVVLTVSSIQYKIGAVASDAMKDLPELINVKDNNYASFGDTCVIGIRVLELKNECHVISVCKSTLQHV